jgi:hypothetical protein
MSKAAILLLHTHCGYRSIPPHRSQQVVSDPHVSLQAQSDMHHQPATKCRRKAIRVDLIRNRIAPPEKNPMVRSGTTPPMSTITYAHVHPVSPVLKDLARRKTKWKEIQVKPYRVLKDNYINC